MRILAVIIAAVLIAACTPNQRIMQDAENRTSQPVATGTPAPQLSDLDRDLQAMQPGQILRQGPEPGLAQPSGVGVDQERRPDLDDDSAERAEGRGGHYDPEPCQCGGSEVRFILTAGPSSELLNKTTLDSIAC